jgi:putative transposase
VVGWGADATGCAKMGASVHFESRHSFRTVWCLDLAAESSPPSPARSMLPKDTPPPGPPGAGLAPPGQAEKPSLTAHASPDRHWHSRGYLPHFESSTAIQHITYRLADSLPAHVVATLTAELASMRPTKREIMRRKRLEAVMDAGHGSCVLRVPAMARLVQDNLLFHDGTRYRLLAWVVMPNHLHVLIQPIAPWAVSNIVASWKSYTGRRISAWRAEARLAPGDPGVAATVWHREYWDRFARDASHLEYFRDYIHLNPVKAGLVPRAQDWVWSSAHHTDARLPSAWE